ncbi:MAG: acyl-CoA carboxylase subunit beta, partial [Chloroflexi bacterium]
MPKLREQKKLTARERLDLLLDAGSFVEDGLFANVLADELPADGVVTGLGTIDGRQVAVMANDPTVKAGSWGARTVEKIVRIQETAGRIRVPMFYLVDSAGARITDQIDMFPGRRHAGRIFFNEVQLSGLVPQICMLFGPSAAGGAYIPAFCDVVVMVEGNASMYLGSPRMVEVVVGEKVTLEELGGARMHATESGLGDALVANDKEAIEFARAYFSFMPQRSGEKPAPCGAKPARASAKPISELIPEEPNRGYDMRKVIDAIVDEGSWLEIKKLFAKELLIGFARLDGQAVGIVANQPMQKG